ncbi:MAG: hypothetical protein JXA10_15305, partial [Anaerolineae bacterium]|nr:hypothetical protein [Anaerolineae bacterium]
MMQAQDTRIANRTAWRSLVIRLLILAGLALIASIPAVPTLTIQPRDSGIFAYFGAELTHG